MSSTRRVQPGARRAQNGWASALEFEELRGLNGIVVAFKAAMLDEPKKKQLLYFLQALSLREGGIKRIARELLEMFPERIGTPTMIKIGCRPCKRLTQAERDEIDEELHHTDTCWDLLHREGDPEREHCQSTATDFCEECRSLADSNLDEFIERLCCDPKLAVTNDPHETCRYREIVRIVLEDAGRGEEAPAGLEAMGLRYFQDVLGALFEYQKRCENQVRENFVETSIGRVVFEALDYALETGRSALVEGDSGIGKTTAIKAWCGLHLGQARHVQLKGITHRTGFFREVARALGIARGGGFSSSKVQMRVEQFLQRTKMMLVFDEGQYLLPSGNRVSTPPELINWLNTACYNEGVPFVISATSEFRDRRAIVEKNTTWQSEQLRRRIRRFFVLPAVPTKDDLRSVACKLLPAVSREAIDYVVGYSLASKGFFQAITNAIEDARLIATRAGRAEIKFSDLKAAIQNWRSPSDAALQRVFENRPKGRCGRASGADVQAQSVSVLLPVEEPLNRLLRPVNSADRREISSVPA
jgi:energy-coupling factor transporter ATP-binding protein EcfA2